MAHDELTLHSRVGPSLHSAPPRASQCPAGIRSEITVIASPGEQVDRGQRTRAPFPSKVFADQSGNRPRPVPLPQRMRSSPWVGVEPGIEPGVLAGLGAVAKQV